MENAKRKQQLPTLDAEELKRVSGGSPSVPTPWRTQPPRQPDDPSQPQPW